MARAVRQEEVGQYAVRQILRRKAGTTEETHKIVDEPLVGTLKHLPRNRSLLRRLGGIVTSSARAGLGAGGRQIKVPAVERLHKAKSVVGRRRSAKMFTNDGINSVGISRQIKAQVSESRLSFGICAGDDRATYNLSESNRDLAHFW